MRSIDLEIISKNRDLFKCPACESGFSRIADDKIECENNHCFPVERGLPLLYSEHDEQDTTLDDTEKIKSFYMENPFPDYEDMDCVGDLIYRSEKSVFAKTLNEKIPFGSRVLEVGCGTGQMSIFLSLSNRDVYGVDLCPNSLHLGRNFRDDNNLNRVYFCQMNLFKPIFRESSFDLVYCSGVLHHTGFPRIGYESICKLVKPNRYIIIGLYNKYLRIPTHIRRFLSRFVDITKIEPVMRQLTTNKKRQTWFMDQYRNPHESSHSISEVIDWFGANGFKFINSIPAARIGSSLELKINPFKEIDCGSKLEIILSQILSIPIFGREGGLFLVIGKRLA